MTNSSNYIIIIVLVLLLSARKRTVKPVSMWIIPALWAFMVLPAIQWQSVGVLEAGMFALCVVVGLALGVIRGKLEKMRVREDGSIVTQGSMVSMLIFVAVLALRLFAEHWGQTHSFVSFANALMFIPLGTICARRIVIYRRYQAMLSRRGM
ncbi:MULTISPECIES: CcdC protein domain-containing protein [Paenibacillus]|uniref:DUF1453 family protein n=1 Tax=Paenibacillus albilobatus TaxID=2716884 RepID=A0A920CCF7_9BACL|nr:MULTISPECIES: CcdC protein domain-containing protein [Paenibacillus]GIO31527.1 hypothetical protein J2TS6_26680 [Paenibacillus albilobatus]